MVLVFCKTLCHNPRLPDSCASFEILNPYGATQSCSLSMPSRSISTIPLTYRLVMLHKIWPDNLVVTSLGLENIGSPTNGFSAIPHTCSLPKVMTNLGFYFTNLQYLSIFDKDFCLFYTFVVLIHPWMGKKCSSLLSTLRTRELVGEDLKPVLKQVILPWRTCGECTKGIKCNPEKAVIKLLTIVDQTSRHLAISAAGWNSLYRIQSNLDLFFSIHDSLGLLKL